jgi:hypothetical protein
VLRRVTRRYFDDNLTMKNMFFTLSRVALDFINILIICKVVCVSITTGRVLHMQISAFDLTWRLKRFRTSSVYRNIRWLFSISRDPSNKSLHQLEKSFIFNGLGTWGNYEWKWSIIADIFYFHKLQTVIVFLLLARLPFHCARAREKVENEFFPSNGFI